MGKKDKQNAAESTPEKNTAQQPTADEAAKTAETAKADETAEKSAEPEAFTVTREQMVTIFFRYAKFCGVKTEAGTLDAFRDAASVSDYAREAMGWAVKAGLVKGDGQDLMPKATASRAQAAAILHRFAAVVEK